MSINSAFCGHGIWLELSPLKGLKRYANYKTPLPPNPSTTQLVDKFIDALHDMKMSSVWFEIFNRFGVIDKDGKQGTKELVDGLKANGISAVPWGYCRGSNSASADEKKNDLALIKDLCDNKYKLGVFCADIEPWNEWTVTVDGKPTKIYDTWDATALHNLVSGLNSHFSKERIGISSFANLDSQDKARDYLVPVVPLVSFCAPQIYWNKRDPLQWARASLKSWRNAGVTVDLIATTQSYWNPKDDGTDTCKHMEKKLSDFLAGFADSDYSAIVGLNWYHAGGPNTDAEGAMSQPMIDAIIEAKLDQKPYKKANTDMDTII